MDFPLKRSTSPHETPLVPTIAQEHVLLGHLQPAAAEGARRCWRRLRLRDIRLWLRRGHQSRVPTSSPLANAT